MSLTLRSVVLFMSVEGGLIYAHDEREAHKVTARWLLLSSSRRKW